MRGSTAGLANGVLKAPNTLYNQCLELIDILITSAVVGPLVVIYWRGTWNLSTIFIFPDQPLYSALTSTLVGNAGQLVCTYFNAHLCRKFHPNKHRLLFYIASRTYTYVYGIICVNTWRGVWQLLAVCTEQTFSNVLWQTGVSLVLLCLLHTLRNLSASPFSISLDAPDDYFAVPTMFKKAVRERVEGTAESSVQGP